MSASDTQKRIRYHVETALQIQNYNPDSWRTDCHYVISRALAALQYSDEMASSSLTCLEDIEKHVKNAIHSLCKQKGIILGKR